MEKNEKTIYSLINVNYWFAKAFGMAPYDLQDKKIVSTAEMRPSGILNFLISSAVSVIMTTCFVNLILYRIEGNFFNQANKILYILFTLRVLSGVITLLMFFFRQQDFIDAYEKLHDFDKKKQIFVKPKYNVYYIINIVFILVILALIFGIEVMYFYTMEEKVNIIMLDLLCNGFQLGIHLIVLLYFEFYVIIITNNFKYIKSITKKLNKAFKLPGELQKEALVVMKTVSLMYDDLCKGAGSINNVFSFPLFSIISLNFMQILLGIYLLQDKGTRTVPAIFWTVFYTLQQLFILLPPGTAESEAQEITSYLSEAERDTEEKLANERNYFLLRTLHQNISFSACGFFPISMAAIIGQFSISISFLLFMFQIIT